LLIAQSMVEPLILLTADPGLETFGGLIRLVFQPRWIEG
jgi:hypothetical protein